MELFASIGVRLSKQAKGSNLSLEGSLNDCRALAMQLGATVIAEHVDDGVSGSIKERQKFVAWLNDGITGRAHILITPHADRVARTGLYAAARVMEVVDGTAPGSVGPVRLVTVDGLDSERDPEGFELAFGMRSVFAKGELRRIRTRNQTTRRRLIEQERWTGGPIPFGCHVVERLNDAGKLVKYLEAEPAESDVLNYLADRVIAGQSRNSLLRWMVKQGIKTRKGKDFVDRTLKVALTTQAAHKLVFEPAKSRALTLALEPKSENQGGGDRGRPQAWLLARGNGVCDSCSQNVTTSRKNYVCDNPACDAQVGIKAEPVDAWLEAEILDAYGSVRYPVVVTEIEGVLELEEARQTEEDAQAALLASPTAETAAVFAAAKEALAALEAQPASRRRRVVMSENTFGEDWAEASIPERAKMLRWAINEPVRILPLAKARELPQDPPRDMVRGEDGVYRFVPAAEPEEPAEPVKVDRRRVNPAARVRYKLAVGGATGWPAK